MLSTLIALAGLLPVAQSGLIPRGTRVTVFETIFQAFLVLGTAVGVVVIAYMLWKAWKYRADGTPDTDDDRPELGELPQGGGKGRKLFLSFGLSAIIVISLIVWTYGTLLFVEEPATAMEEEELDITVYGQQFIWQFEYPNGHTTTNELRVPRGVRVSITVTSKDVFHNFGSPGLRVKSDAIPGHNTTTWFMGDETGEYYAACYELCGSGHSGMEATIIVMEPDDYQQWYQNTTSS